MSDLVARSYDSLGLKAVQWVVANLESFDPIAHDGSVKVDTVKPFAELAFLASIVEQKRHSVYKEAFRAATEFVERTAQRNQLRDRFLRQPSLFLLYGNIYTALERWSRQEHSWHLPIQRLIDSGYLTTMEMVPFRKIDLFNMLEATGYRHDLPSPQELYRNTLAFRMPSVLYLTNDDAYAITHTLFYLADFGSQDLRLFLGERYADTVMYVEMLLGMYLRKQNWDIAGELLICCDCLGSRPEPFYRLGWEGIARAQLDSGEIIGPKFDRNSPKLAAAAEARKYCFDQNYHTTLVGIGAALCSSRPEPDVGRQP